VVEPSTAEQVDERSSSARVLARSQHPISRSRIHPNALKVLYRLERSGHLAFLVGGSVRDLMLGGRPKDFDVATDASPEEVRRLFRNSRIIGRRFRLVHVYFHGFIVEVSTFRSVPDPDAQAGVGELLVTDDNVFGTPKQDAFRRDFTVNALFYSIADFSVLDYVGGVEDLEHQLIRVIGDPDLRLREDPVRMMRACEMAGRLGFGIEEEAQRAIRRHSGEIAKAAPARLVEELLDLLHCGHAGSAVEWMNDLGLADVLLPEVRSVVEAEREGLGSFGEVIPVIDRIVLSGRELSDSLLLSGLLVPAVLLARHRRETKLGLPLSRAAVRRLAESSVASLGTRLSLSNVRAQRTALTLTLFQRLCEPPPLDWRVSEVTTHPAYADAVHLFEMLIEATGEGEESLEAWRAAALDTEGAPPSRRPKRRRRSRPRHRKH